MKDKWRHGIGIALAVAAVGCMPLMDQSAAQDGGGHTSAFAADEAAVETGLPAAPRYLIPGGQVVGVALKTRGVLVVAKADGGRQGAQLRVGDVILSVQGEQVDSAQELAEQVDSAGADSVELAVMRAGKEVTLQAASPLDGVDGRRRLGVWVRDSTAGVGTLSYIDPVSRAYGALGHAIVDADTGSMLSLQDGALMNARVVGVVRGQSGRAGELRGSFLKENQQIGSLELNSEFGIYGRMDEALQAALYPQGLPVGMRDEVHPGPAAIISTVDQNGPQEYAIEIERCFAQSQPGQKNMVIRVTDGRLIEKTGGIVQGMSGSPIIQDGRIVGAVTHVLVNDPTRGYGIFIENMLDAAG